MEIITAGVKLTVIPGITGMTEIDAWLLWKRVLKNEINRYISVIEPIMIEIQIDAVEIFLIQENLFLSNLFIKSAGRSTWR
jgi:hypothetical protein